MGLPRSRTVQLAIVVAVAYYLAARIGFLLRFPPATTSVLWPPNALLTATLLLVPPGRWALCLLPVLPVHLFVASQAGLPLPLALSLYATNCSEALVAAGLIHRWSDAPDRFDSLRRVTSFLAAAVVFAPLLSSFADAAAVHWFQGEAYWPVIRHRVLSNSLSALAIVPSIVVVVRNGRAWLRRPGSRHLEAALLVGMIAATGVAVFAEATVPGAHLPGVPYTSLPFLVPALIWAAARFGPGGASLALLATSLAAIRSATLGWRPLGLLSPEDGVVALQVFVTVVGAPLLCLGALIEERRLATAALAQRLRFEALLARLAGAFVHLAGREMHRAFEAGLEQFSAFVGADRATLRRFTEDGTLEVVYAWLGPHSGTPPPSLNQRDMPWAVRKLTALQPIVLSTLDDFPAEAAAERSLLAGHGVRSLLVLPLVVGDQVLGALVFGALSRERHWSATVVEQAQLVADVFANAMARQQAEEAMRRSEATKAAVMASLNSSVAVLDRAGHIVTVNERWEKALLEESDPPGLSLGGVGSDHLGLWRRLAASGVVEAVAAAAGISRVLVGDQPDFVLEYPCPALPGRWYLMTVMPLRAAEGGAVLALTDVTLRKRAEREAQKSRDELAHYLRVSTMGELTTSLAHELNQPLTAVLANAQAATQLVLEAPGPEAEQLREILDDIAGQGRRAGDIIQRLRDLLRKGEPQRGLLDLNVLAEDVVALLSSDALIRGVSLRLALHPEPITVRGDRIQLQQVLLNLLVNAMEAMSGAGRGSVATVRTEGARHGFVRVSVVDTGPGLRTPLTAGVFEPFYTTKPSGLGMGLSIARSIVVAHDGSIDAANNAGRGATFTVALPVVPQP
jgi:signal transduction histidine kinase/integral membrane sensor domain MASE1